MLTALLIVTVLGGGGPHAVPQHRLENGVIEVRRDGALIASSTTGQLERRLKPGLYRVSSRLSPRGVLPCETTWVRLRSGHTARVHLYCSIR